MKKTLSCILSFVPTVTIFICIIILIFFTGYESLGYEIGTIGVILRILTLLVEVAAFVLGIVLMIIYIVKTIINKNLSIGMKILWCALLFYLSVFLFAILPVYWFVVLRKEQV